MILLCNSLPNTSTRVALLSGPCAPWAETCNGKPIGGAGVAASDPSWGGAPVVGGLGVVRLGMVGLAGAFKG